MVKPDGVQRNFVGEIISRFEAKGFKLCALRLQHASKDLLQRHYADLSSKKFFPDLVTFMASSPVAAMCWEGEGVVKEGRKILGATHPADSLMGTIRGDMAIDIGRNICHGSDSVESAENEISMWFPEEGVVSWDLHSHAWVNEVEEPVSPPATVETKRPQRKARQAMGAAALGDIIADVDMDSEDDEEDYDDDDYESDSEEDDEDAFRLDRHQISLLLGSATTLCKDGLISRQQRGLLKDLILNEDLCMYKAILVHELHNEDSASGEEAFDRLMETLYKIAFGEFADIGNDEDIAYLMGQDDDDDDDAYDDDDFENESEAAGDVDGAGDDDEDEEEAADAKPVHVKKQRRASLVAAQSIIDQVEQTETHGYGGGFGSGSVAEPVTRTTHRRLSLTSADISECI